MLKLLWALPFALFSCKGQPMTGPEIAALLPGRVLIEGELGSTISTSDYHVWTSKGKTAVNTFLFDAYGDWHVADDQYCQQLGISEEPTCYRVYRRPGPKGLTLHFDGFLGFTGLLLPPDTVLWPYLPE